jgi:hypothetical protein
MITPELFDIVELLVDVPDTKLRAGDRGAIVDKHSNKAYEVEFTNSYGETLELEVLSPEQFMVVWQSKTKTWVPVATRLTTMVESMPTERQEQVLNFARSLYQAPA